MAKLQNIVSTVTVFETETSLEAIANKYENVVYNPRKFNAAIIKMQNPKATGLLFSTGSLVCTGTKNLTDNSTACENIRQLLENAGIKNTKLRKMTVHNIVGSGSVDKHIDLIKLTQKHSRLVIIRC